MFKQGTFEDSTDGSIAGLYQLDTDQSEEEENMFLTSRKSNYQVLLEESLEDESKELTAQRTYFGARLSNPTGSSHTEAVFGKHYNPLT